MVMLTLKLDDIPDEGLDLEWREDLPALSEYLETLSEIDFRFEAPLHSEAKIRKVGRSILIKGSVMATLRLQCVRCLKEYVYPITSPFEVILQPAREIDFPEEMDLSRDDLALDFFEGGELQLSEIACEQVFLEIPIQPLCQETCRGLCPHCGTDLNISTCGCHEETLDSRFSRLKEWKLH